MIDFAKKEKEAQDIIDANAKKKTDETRNEKRVQVMTELGLVFSPKENSFVEPEPTALCINFHWSEIVAMTDDKFNETVAKVREVMEKRDSEERVKPDRERLLEYVEKLRAVPIPSENLSESYARFPDQIRNNFDMMEKLIKSA